MREQRVDEHEPTHAFEVNRDTRQVRTRATVPYDDDRWREVDVVDALDRDARATGAQLAGHPRPRERSRERARDEHEPDVGHDESSTSSLSAPRARPAKRTSPGVRDSRATGPCITTPSTVTKTPRACTCGSAMRSRIE